MPDFLFYFIMWKYLLIFDSFLNTQKEHFFKYCKQMEHQPSSVEVMLSSCLIVCSFPQQPFGLTGAAQNPKGQ